MTQTVLKGVAKTYYDSGLAEGKSEGKAEYIISALQNRFNRVPPKIANTISRISDSATLDSLFNRALTCQSLSSFSELLK